jgi:photosystem II stability/assembly factor-like uncharacterized protein
LIVLSELCDFAASDPGLTLRNERATKKALRAERRRAYPDENHDGSIAAQPNRDYYIYPRTFNSNVPISKGLLNAVEFRANQERSLALRKMSFINQWTCAGPFNSAGRMRIVRYHPTNPDILYAGAASGGVWKTTDGGNTWKALTDNFPTLAVGHLVIDPKNPETVFAGTGEGTNNADAVYGTGLYKTTDGGATWNNLLSSITSNDQCVNHIELHPDGSDTILAAVSFNTSSGGLFKTTNGGSSWTNVLAGPARTVVIDRAIKGRVVLGMGYYNGSSLNGIYISDAGGDRYSFSRVTTNLPPADSMGRIEMDASPSYPGAIMAVVVTSAKRAATSSGSSYHGDLDLLGIYRSTNSGTSWERMACSDNPTIKGFMRAQGDYDLFIRFHPTNHKVLYMGGIETWRSTDFGVSWTKVSSQNDPMISTWCDMHSADFNPTNPSQLVVSSDGGIYRTNDCLASKVLWDEMAGNLATMQFYGISIDNSSPKRMLGGTQDRRNNLGMVGNPQWTRLSWGGDGGYTLFDYSSPTRYYVESQFGNIARTDNNGGSFTGITKGLERTDASGNNLMSFVAPFIMHPTNSNILFIGGHKVYRTLNRGSQWIAISDDLTKGLYWTRQFQDMALCNANPNYVWGVTGSTGAAFRSTNAMAAVVDNITWDNVTGTVIGQKLPALYLNSIAVHPVDGNIAYVGTSAFDSKSGVYKTTDGGATWSFMTGSTSTTMLPKCPIGAIAIWDKNPDVVFAGTDVGVYVSTDAGANWMPFGDGLPNVVIDDLKITSDDILFAGTHGRGMWYTSAIVMSQSDVEALPESNAIGAIYPNPCPLNATVPCMITRRTNVRLRVYDASGREVCTVVNQVLSAGSHRFSMNTSNLNSGVYFARLDTDDGHWTRRFAVVR